MEGDDKPRILYQIQVTVGRCKSCCIKYKQLYDGDFRLREGRRRKEERLGGDETMEGDDKPTILYQIQVTVLRYGRAVAVSNTSN
jgi:hypothetical protein